MSYNTSREPMLDLFIFETLQLIEQLEQSVISSEKSNALEGSINEIFRIMHTIKGSSAMMLFNNISTLAHSLEDVFYFMREEKPQKVNYSALTDIVLEVIDFIKNEIAKIENGENSDGDSSSLIESIKVYLSALKNMNPSSSTHIEEKIEKEAPAPQPQYYISSSKAAALPGMSRFKAVIFFEEGCEMENVRAFTVVHNLKGISDEIEYSPSDILDNPESSEVIKKEGFELIFSSHLSTEEVRANLTETVFLKELELDTLDDNYDYTAQSKKNISINLDEPAKETVELSKTTGQNTSASKHKLISVNVQKLDNLMDLVGELVISEAMVTQNPELKGLQLDGFNKAASQLEKITTELQDTVMSIRMVPLSATFQKMNRIVRDMCKKLSKDVQLEVLGEETEVDKNIIEHISDPLMHLIRNSLDHGIEPAAERLSKGKPDSGKIILEAKNSGGDVWIIVKDDGKGLNKEKILGKARDNDLIHKPENELTDKEIYSFILLPGFSTKESVSEFSGRGVGMDVVTKNIENLGGSVLIDSTPGMGTTMSIKIPLTLAIIDGMILSVGKSSYTIPTISIKESFRPKENNIILDPDGNEMILIRGECYPILRLHKLHNVGTSITNIHEGIVIMAESSSGSVCIFADALIGQQQVVVKALPKFIKKVEGLAGCTLLGDGSISLILDVAGLTSY